MAVRETSLHDSLRLLRTYLPDYLTEAQNAVGAPPEKATVWVPESAALGPGEAFAWTFADKAASCTVRPDHLQPLEELAAADLVASGLDEAGVQKWLEAKVGKEAKVGGVTGVPAHFAVIQDGARPGGQGAAPSSELALRSVRDGEEVRCAEGSKEVPLACESAEELMKLLGSDLQVAMVLLCRSLHVTELVCKTAKVDSCYIIEEAMLQLDETANYLCGTKWGTCRFPVPFGRPELPEEAAIHELDGRTGASLKFTLLNGSGRVWTLIAGGGASVVYTDTICDYGFAKELANYGEYSGDPPEAFVYEYAKTILGVMTSSPEPKGKVLLIGGGVANFTDVASTFKGIVKALKQYGEALKANGTTVWVRRGGPNYSEGLALMKRCCEEIGVEAHVYGPEAHLTSIVRDALGSGKPLAPLPPPTVKLPTKAASDAAPAGAGGVVRFEASTQAIVYGLQAKAVQRMLDFDTLCGRKTPSVVAVINPTGEATFEKFMFGSADVLIPIFTSLDDAVERTGKDEKILVNFASFRSVHSATMDALKFSDVLKTHAIIAEGVPEALTRRLHQAAAAKGVGIIGPATVGGMMPGRFRIGNAGGAVENLLLAKLYRPGSVGYTTKSGGMSNELNNIVALNTDGVREGTAGPVCGSSTCYCASRQTPALR